MTHARGAAGAGGAEPGCPSPATGGSPSWSPELGAHRPPRPAPAGRRTVGDVRGRAARLAACDPERELDQRRAPRHPIRDPRATRSGRISSTTSPAPSRSNDRAAVPIGLWAKGPVRLDALAASVAVVGSRAATTYGDQLAARHRPDAGRGRPPRGLGCGLRDRPRRTPRRARRWRANGRGPGLRRRPRLSRGPRVASRSPRGVRRGGLRGAARLRTPADQVPCAQPADRWPHRGAPWSSRRPSAAAPSTPPTGPIGSTGR